MVYTQVIWGTSGLSKREINAPILSKQVNKTQPAIDERFTRSRKNLRVAEAILKKWKIWNPDIEAWYYECVHQQGRDEVYFVIIRQFTKKDNRLGGWAGKAGKSGKRISDQKRIAENAEPRHRNTVNRDL